MSETTVPNSTVNNNAANKKSVANLFQSKWINNNMMFILYLAVLAIVYIAYGHWTDKTIRKINKTQTSLKEYQYEFKTVKAEVMATSEEKEVIKATQPLGLQISNDVPKRIVANTKK